MSCFLNVLLFSPPETDSRKKVIDYAEKCLAKAAEYKLIKPAGEAGSDDED